MVAPGRALPPYEVIARTGPGLVIVADRRDGTRGLWSRALRGGGGQYARERERRCANCEATIVGPFYKPPARDPGLADRLCATCVEGDYA